jgi:folate-dependent phosphoribosylglycinamide formyltransferase PurN
VSAADRRGGVVLLASTGESTRIVYHALASRFGDVRVIMEPPVARGVLLRRRLRTLGARRVLGQVLFMGTVVPLLRRRGRARVEEICREHGLHRGEIPAEVVRVGSVNDSAAREALATLAPRVVVVNGTRIIGRETLRSVEAPFVNLHHGITPLYRGVHGGYWALAEGRPDLAGSTVHLVDEGIDTGGIVAQATFHPGPTDTFATYPYLHLAVGIAPLLEAVERGLEGKLQTGAAETGPLPSRLRTHPTLAEYLSLRRSVGVG